MITLPAILHINVGSCVIELFFCIILCLSQYIILKRQLGVCCHHHWQL